MLNILKDYKNYVESQDMKRVLEDISNFIMQENIVADFFSFARNILKKSDYISEIYFIAGVIKDTWGAALTENGIKEENKLYGSIYGAVIHIEPDNIDNVKILRSIDVTEALNFFREPKCIFEIPTGPITYKDTDVFVIEQSLETIIKKIVVGADIRASAFTGVIIKFPKKPAYWEFTLKRRNANRWVLDMIEVDSEGIIAYLVRYSQKS